MQLNITGHNVEITEALRDFLNTKFAKLEQYFERINQVYIVLKVEKVTPTELRASSRVTSAPCKITPENPYSIPPALSCREWSNRVFSPLLSRGAARY